jgi:type VI secretion system secreted protein Hcp
MKLGDIKGQVTESQHKEWIELHSLQYGVGRGIPTAVGAGTNREASLPSVSEIVCTKGFDNSSVELYKLALAGKAKEGVLHCVTVGGNEQTHTYLEIKLTDCLISGYSMSSGGDKPSESISLNFTKIEYRFIGLDAKGGELAPKSAGWDLSQQKAF